MYNCPICNKPANTIRGLRKHLQGGIKYGGHELCLGKIDDIIAIVENDNHISSNSGDRKQINIPTLNSISPHEKFIYDYFVALIKNKQIPKYRFEQRVDIILQLFLPEILSQYFKGKVEFVLPEFPIKSEKNNRSTNVDYLFYLTDNNGKDKWIFLELKTDDGSVRKKQLTIYTLAQKVGMRKILDDFVMVQRKMEIRLK